MSISYEPDDFPALADIKTYAKETWGEDHPNDQSAFEDAFQNGMFHEEEPFWSYAAQALPEKSLLNFALTTIRLVVVGTGASDADTKLAMKFYDAFYKWTKNHLKSEKEVLEPLAEFREMLFRRAIADHSAWWADMPRGFSLVDMAIQIRMGLWGHPIETMYEVALRKAIDGE
jgi:hypothetical protein